MEYRPLKNKVEQSHVPLDTLLKCFHSGLELEDVYPEKLLQDAIHNADKNRS